MSVVDLCLKITMDLRVANINPNSVSLSPKTHIRKINPCLGMTRMPTKGLNLQVGMLHLGSLHLATLHLQGMGIPGINRHLLLDHMTIRHPNVSLCTWIGNLGLSRSVIPCQEDYRSQKRVDRRDLRYPEDDADGVWSPRLCKSSLAWDDIVLAPLARIAQKYDER